MSAFDDSDDMGPGCVVAAWVACFVLFGALLFWAADDIFGTTHRAAVVALGTHKDGVTFYRDGQILSAQAPTVTISAVARGTCVSVEWTVGRWIGAGRG